MTSDTNTKALWQSKTLWVNIIMALTAMFYTPANEYLIAHPEAVTTGFAVINVILRLVTKTGLVIE